MKLKVMTYNVLADEYTKTKGDLGHYKTADLRVVQDFEYRATIVIREIQADIKNTAAAIDTSKPGIPDIICLQEVDHFEDFYKPHLASLGYEVCLKYRRGLDAVLIGWKRDQFRLLDKQEIEYEELGGLFLDFASDFKRGNVGLLCVLEHVQSKKVMVVGNTHIHWNPKFDHVKLWQGYLLTKCTSELLRKHNLAIETTPLLLCGDFNSTPESSLVHFMHGVAYLPEIDGRSDPAKGVKAYQKQQGVQKLKQV